MADQQSAYSPDEILAAAYPGMGLKTVKLGNKTAVVHESMADALSKANADFFAATGKNIMPASSFRTKETQQKLYNELHPKGAAVAKPGNSRHEKGLALDVGNWMAAAPYLKKYGLDNPIKGDANHFQLANKPKATPLSAARNMVADASGRATPPASENAQSDPSGYTIEELYKAAGKDIPIAAKKYSGYTIGEIQKAAGVGGGDQEQPGQIPPPRPVEGPLAPGARPPDMRNPQDLDAAVKQVDTIRNKPIAERLRENAKSAAPVTDTVLPIAGMAAGGLAATPTGPMGMVAGSALGYGAGRQAARAIREAGGETPERGAKPVIEAGKDLAEGALMEAGGQVAGKAIEGAASLTGKIAKPLLGRLTGTGTAAVDEALKSGESTGLFSGNPLKSKTMFDKALRGEISGDEVVDNAKEALGIVKDKRQAAYQTELKKVSSNKANIDTRPAWGKIQALMDRYGIKANPNGTFDTSRIAMGKAGRKDIADVLSTMKNWGKKPGDNTAMGLDTLKRQLDDFYSDSSQARQFVASMRNEVKDLIVKNVPEYGKMTKDYAEATKLIKDIESGLMMRKQGMSGRIVADQTLRRLTSAMRDNFSLRKDLVDALGGVSGKDIAGQVAGHSMSSLMPRGLAGTGPAVTSEIALAHFVHPGFWPVLVASSPRVTGEFLRMFGKGMAEARKLKPALRLLGPTGVAVKAKKEPGTEQEDPWREIGGDEY